MIDAKWGNSLKEVDRQLDISAYSVDRQLIILAYSVDRQLDILAYSVDRQLDILAYSVDREIDKFMDKQLHRVKNSLKTQKILTMIKFKDIERKEVGILNLNYFYLIKRDWTIQKQSLL